MNAHVLLPILLLLVGTASGSEGKPNRAAPTLTLASIVPKDLINRDGYVLAMIGTESCPASRDFRSSYFTSLTLPLQVEKTYVNLPPGTELKYFPTPMFILFKDRVPLDIHVGIVSSMNKFAADANAKIIDAILVRNGLKQGAEWALATNEFSPRSGYDYQALKFFSGTGIDFQNHSMKRTLFSEAKLPKANFAGATFETTVFSHVDLTGARLTKEQAVRAIFLNCICPDGIRSNAAGNTCADHVHSARVAGEER